MPAAPVLSIVIANYNRLEWLQRCLGALEMQKPELLERFEVVLVDDGSAPAVVDYIKAYRGPYRFRYLLQKNQGPAVARNRGTEAAEGDYIAYIDNDSVAPPDWMDRAFEAIGMIREKIVGVIGPIDPYPDPTLYNELTDAIQTISVMPAYKKKLYLMPHANTNNLIYAKQPLLDVGIFDEKYPYPAFEDTDLGFRLERKGYKILEWEKLRIFHPNEMDWNTLRKKNLMHGASIRRFAFKFAFRYPVHVAFLLALNFRALALYFAWVPVFAFSSKASEQKLRFLRSWYTLQGFLGRKIRFKSKNS